VELLCGSMIVGNGPWAVIGVNDIVSFSVILVVFLVVVTCVGVAFPRRCRLS